VKTIKTQKLQYLGHVMRYTTTNGLRENSWKK